MGLLVTYGCDCCDIVVLHGVPGVGWLVVNFAFVAVWLDSLVNFWFSDVCWICAWRVLVLVRFAGVVYFCEFWVVRVVFGLCFGGVR